MTPPRVNPRCLDGSILRDGRLSPHLQDLMETHDVDLVHSQPLDTFELDSSLPVVSSLGFVNHFS